MKVGGRMMSADVALFVSCFEQEFTFLSYLIKLRAEKRQTNLFY